MNRKIEDSMLMLFVLADILIAMFFLQSYTGLLVGKLEAQAGTITEINLELTHPAYSWQGFYGVAIMDQLYNASQYADAIPGGMTEKNLIFECMAPGTSHETIKLGTFISR